MNLFRRRRTQWGRLWLAALAAIVMVLATSVQVSAKKPDAPPGNPDPPGQLVDLQLHPEIDVVVSGHTHLPYVCQLPDPAGQDRLVTSAYSFGRVVTEMNLVLDNRTKVGTFSPVDPPSTDRANEIG